MAKKEAFNYFDAFEKQVGYAQEMALNLQSALERGELGTKELKDALHTIENDADQINHDIQHHLVSDFVVPLEREGMVRLAHMLDDICDTIEDVAIKAYIYNCTCVLNEWTTIAALMVEATGSLKIAVGLLEKLPKASAELKEHLVKAQTLESDCDQLYIESAAGLYRDASLDAEQRRIRHQILLSLEETMDSLENTAECIESIMTQNM